MIAPHGLLHSHINLWGATLVTFGPLSIVAHTCLPVGINVANREEEQQLLIRLKQQGKI